jgi:fructose-1,6-bisphosphatase/inositol monophosphatase family enzyme
LDLFTLRHSVCYFFCSGSLAVDPVDGTLNYIIALLLSPISLAL